MRRILAATLLMVSVPGSAVTAQWTSARPDGHAPISVMGDHMHDPGELMLSYRYMNMDMEGSRVGTAPVADADIVSPTGLDYIVTPTKMAMQMHMFGAMLGVTRHVTLMAMLPVLSNSMDHLARNGNTFTTESGSVGDFNLSGLFSVASWDKQFLMGQIGVSMPTGSTFQADTTPVSGGQASQLPYPMQTGSGTWDIIAALTYQGQGNVLSWGAQAKGLIRTGTNDNGYRVGNNYLGTAWGGVKLSRNFSASLRGAFRRVENITGTDDFLTDPVTFMTPGGPQTRPAAQFVPTADPNLRAGSYGDVAVGINFSVPSGLLHGFRLAAEGIVPVYQKLDGPQLETDWIIMFGAQYTIELGIGH